MPYATLQELAIAAQLGQLVSFPTDTVPALACKPEAAEQLFIAKARDSQKPLILMGAEATDLWPYVQGSAEEMAIWQAIATQYWPGALTLVLPASSACPRAMNPHSPTSLGIRVPAQDMARELLRHTGPLATTSANRSGQEALRDPEAIAQQFPTAQVLSPILVGGSGYAGSGQASTVVRWTGAGWQTLRLGAITL